MNVSTVNMEENTTSRECTTQQDMFDATRPVLTDCFSGAFALSFYSDRLFDILGFMGDFERAQQVLEGTYIRLP